MKPAMNVSKTWFIITGFLLGILIIFLFILTGCSEKNQKLNTNSSVKLISDTLDWSIRMADSEIFRLKDSLEFGGSDKKAKWNYQTGLFLKSLLDLSAVKGEPDYTKYVQKVIDSFVQDDGTIKTYKMSDYNIDNLNSGKALLSLYSITNNEKYKLAAQLLRKQLDTHPRTNEGGFWHKKRYPWQMWLAGIYMGSPFYAEYSKMFNEPGGYSDVIKQITIIDVQTRNPETGLRHHGWDESNKQAWADPWNSCSPHSWGRGMGWYAMALVDILDCLPENYKKRDKVIFIFKDLATAIVKYQDKETGLWRHVLDQGDRKGNYFESSASSMFVYALAKGINKDYIDTSYIPVAQSGYNGLLRYKITVDDTGLVSLNDICSVAGLGGNPYRDGSFDYYISEPVVSNDLKGVGPFIMASLQLEMMKN